MNRACGVERQSDRALRQRHDQGCGSAGVKDLKSILAELRALQPELKKRYPIKELGVFGSYVRGEQREDSDLDVLVDLGEGMTLVDLVRL